MTGKKREKVDGEETDAEVIILEKTWLTTKGLSDKVETIADICYELKEMQLSKKDESEVFRQQLLKLEKLHNLKIESDEIKSKEMEDARIANLKLMKDKVNEAERNRDIIESEMQKIKHREYKRTELKREETSDEDSDDISIGLVMERFQITHNLLRNN
eukprot:GHVR01180855.1.p1 GENE.GHVR01180855.1~~GHVR01180855.1.p1  ORF type:complete len:159 (-),score=33.47 GHVR01180855.1:1000-1476(-)